MRGIKLGPSGVLDLVVDMVKGVIKVLASLGYGVFKKRCLEHTKQLF